MESCNVVKDGFRHGGREVVSTSIVFLMAVNCNLKGQDGQHQEIILQRKKTRLCEAKCFSLVTLSNLHTQSFFLHSWCLKEQCFIKSHLYRSLEFNVHFPCGIVTRWGYMHCVSQGSLRDART